MADPAGSEADSGGCGSVAWRLDAAGADAKTVTVGYAETVMPTAWLLGQLWNCRDIMPSTLCADLGMREGSTYAMASATSESRGRLVMRRHRLALPALLLVLALAPAVAAQTRVDLYDRNSRRTGSVTIDERTGRIDTYDTRSNRSGYGQVDQRTGKIDFYDLRGNRTGSGTLTPSASTREERR